MLSYPFFFPSKGVLDAIPRLVLLQRAHLTTTTPLLDISNVENLRERVQKRKHRSNSNDEHFLYQDTSNIRATSRWYRTMNDSITGLYSSYETVMDNLKTLDLPTPQAIQVRRQAQWKSCKPDHY